MFEVAVSNDHSTVRISNRTEFELEDLASTVIKLNEPSVLDAVCLGVGDRKDNAFA